MVTEERFISLVQQVTRLVEVVKQQATMIHNLTVRLDKVEEKANDAHVAAHWNDPQM